MSHVFIRDKCNDVYYFSNSRARCKAFTKDRSRHCGIYYAIYATMTNHNHIREYFNNTVYGEPNIVITKPGKFMPQTGAKPWARALLFPQITLFPSL